jgi:GNAT superfamily N-acetyltransferase
MAESAVRAAEAAEIEALARLWHEGWHDGHAAIVHEELTRVTTVDRFAERIARVMTQIRVVGALGAPSGFAIVKDDELDQLYVARAARGTGVAALLIADAESRLREAGVTRAWLACAIGNDRAARFYERSGWIQAGRSVNRLEVPSGTLLVDVWRYEKTLG